MATPQQLYDSIRAQAIDTDSDFTTNTELRTYLLQAGQTIYSRIGIGEDKDTSITTVASTEEYTLVASDSSETVRVVTEVLFNKVRLTRIDRRELAGIKGLSYGGVNSTGNPSYYWIYDNKIGLYQVPSTAQTLEVRYNSSFTSDILTGTNDSSTTILSQFTEEMQWAMVHLALSRIYLKDQDNRHQVEEAAWERALTRAETEWFKRNHKDEMMGVIQEEALISNIVGRQFGYRT